MSAYSNPGQEDVFGVDGLECPSFLKDYLKHLLLVRNLAARTVKNYYGQLSCFLRWTVIRHDPKATKTDHQHASIVELEFQVLEEIKEKDIYDYITFTATVLRNGAETRSLKLTAIKGMFDYFCGVLKVLSINPAANVAPPKKEKKLPKYLSTTQSKELMQAAKDSSNGEFPERDFCMVTFMLNCGMRVSELVGMDVVHIKDNNYVRLYGKGRKERDIYLNPACQKALKAYMDKRNDVLNGKSECALFISKRTLKRITTRRVQQIVRHLFDAINMSGQGYSPHKLRHTAATLMYQNGAADVLQLQKILGHENIGTTSIYTHLNDNAVKEAMEKSPLANLE